MATPLASTEEAWNDGSPGQVSDAGAPPSSNSTVESLLSPRIRSPAKLEALPDDPARRLRSPELYSIADDGPYLERGSSIEEIYERMSAVVDASQHAKQLPSISALPARVGRDSVGMMSVSSDTTKERYTFTNKPSKSTADTRYRDAVPNIHGDPLFENDPRNTIADVPNARRRAGKGEAQDRCEHVDVGQRKKNFDGRPEYTPEDGYASDDPRWSKDYLSVGAGKSWGQESKRGTVSRVIAVMYRMRILCAVVVCALTGAILASRVLPPHSSVVPTADISSELTALVQSAKIADAYSQHVAPIADVTSTYIADTYTDCVAPIVDSASEKILPVVTTGVNHVAPIAKAAATYAAPVLGSAAKDILPIVSTDVEHVLQVADAAAEQIASTYAEHESALNDVVLDIFASFVAC